MQKAEGSEWMKVRSLCFIMICMVEIVVGERVGKNGRLGVGCSASIFDKERDKVLLVRRADNDKWAVPGGYMESGESFSEACKREVLEETGLDVIITRLIGVYTSPHFLLEYPDGNKWQLAVLHFAAEIIGGKLTTGFETTQYGFFTSSEIKDLEMTELDRRRVLDGFGERTGAIICDDFSS